MVSHVQEVHAITRFSPDQEQYGSHHILPCPYFFLCRHPAKGSGTVLHGISCFSDNQEIRVRYRRPPGVKIKRGKERIALLERGPAVGACRYFVRLYQRRPPPFETRSERRSIAQEASSLGVCGRHLDLEILSIRKTFSDLRISSSTLNPPHHLHTSMQLNSHSSPHLHLILKNALGGLDPTFAENAAFKIENPPKMLIRMP